jgi:hypothetical protein
MPRQVVIGGNVYNLACPPGFQEGGPL